jgi:mono/diheme cytochrome c family protein
MPGVLAGHSLPRNNLRRIGAGDCTLVKWPALWPSWEGELQIRNGMWVAALLLAPIAGVAQPSAAARATFQRVCGSCHAVETVTAQRRTRAQWQESINSMITRGAKATDEDFAAILDYLTTQYGPAAPGPPAFGGRGRGAAFSPGPADKQVIDTEAATRGRKVYAAECITCHGTHARGSDRGADLVRSEIVLHDRYGSTIGPFLKKGHPTQTTPAAQLTAGQIEDLSHTIHQEVYNTLRAALQIQDVLTGDAKAGAAYFNGEGKCSSCHSPAGDLAQIGSRMDPPALQQRFLFPGGRGGGRGGRGGRGSAPSKPVTVTVTPASGSPITGTLVHLDDFNVALRDGAGEYHSFRRTPALKVVKNDPMQAHHELLDRYTDKNVHDIVAYLETLK